MRQRRCSRRPLQRCSHRYSQGCVNGMTRKRVSAMPGAGVDANAEGDVGSSTTEALAPTPVAAAGGAKHCSIPWPMGASNDTVVAGAGCATPKRHSSAAKARKPRPRRPRTPVGAQTQVFTPAPPTRRVCSSHLPKGRTLVTRRVQPWLTLSGKSVRGPGKVQVRVQHRGAACLRRH